MSTYTILSVNEDNGHSDRLTAKFQSHNGRFGDWSTMKISVTDSRKLIIGKIDGNGLVNQNVEFQDIDLDGLIQYLQDVKVFLSEEDMVKKLMGIRK